MAPHVVENGDAAPRVTAPGRRKAGLAAKASDAEEEAAAAAPAARKRKRPAADVAAAEAAPSKPKARGAKGAKAVPKAKARGLSSLKGSTDAKAKIMKSWYTAVHHQSSKFLQDVELDAEKEWAFAKGDKSGTDDSDYAALLQCIAKFRSVETDTAFNSQLILAFDFSSFKKAKLSEMSEEQWETKLDKFNCSLDQHMLSLQDQMESMMEQRDLRSARKARMAVS